MGQRFRASSLAQEPVHWTMVVVVLRASHGIDTRKFTAATKCLRVRRHKVIYRAVTMRRGKEPR